MPRPKLTFILSAAARREAAGTLGLHQLMEAIVNSPAFLRAVQARAVRELDRQIAGKAPSEGMPELLLPAARQAFRTKGGA